MTSSWPPSTATRSTAPSLAASLLIHEGRLSIIEIAQQLGHGADMTLKTYGHVLEELKNRPRLSAEDQIRSARGKGQRNAS